MKFSEFIISLTDEETSIYQELVSPSRVGGANLKSIRGDFARFAVGVLGGRGENINITEIIRGFNEQFAVEQDPNNDLSLAQLCELFPYPLNFKTQALIRDSKRRDEGENVPQFAYDICSLMGLVIRLNAVIVIKNFAIGSKGKDYSLNALVNSTIRAPSDGSWLSLLRQLGKKTPDHGTSILTTRLMNALNTKVKLSNRTRRTVFQYLESLVSFRNRLIHGEKITGDELNEAKDMIFASITALQFFAEFNLVVFSDGDLFRINGTKPEKIANVDLEMPENEPCLVSKKPPYMALSLSPLIYFSEGYKTAIEFDELFFLNAGDSENLSYIAYKYSGHIDGKKIGSYQAFKDFVATIPSPPVPENPKLDFSILAKDYSKTFVGRDELLREIDTFVSNNAKPYGMVKALAGMGKTAIFAHLYNRFCINDKKLVENENKWIFHFTSYQQGRDRADVTFRSIIAQICDAFKLDWEDWLSSDVEVIRDQKFPELIRKVSDNLLEVGQRLIIAIDAIDEAKLTDDVNLMSMFPTFVPDNIVFLLSYRVDENNHNAGVENNLQHLLPNRIAFFDNANPLSGLTRDNVIEFMKRVMNSSSVNSKTLNAVWKASSEGKLGADPFYLRFIAEGIEAGRIDGSREETIPESIDDAFDIIWLHLPTERNFLVHRLLCTLALMFDYGDDIFFAEYFNSTGEISSDPLNASDITMIRTKAGKFLKYDGDKYTLFHDRLRYFLVGQQIDPFGNERNRAN